VNACLDRVNELITTATSDFYKKDLALTRLQEEFAAELATLRGRVDALEASAAELKLSNFPPQPNSLEVVVGVRDRDWRECG